MDPPVVDLSAEGADQLIEEPKTVEPSPGAVNATKKRKGETAEDKRKRKKGRQELLRATGTLHSLYPRYHVDRLSTRSVTLEDFTPAGNRRTRSWVWKHYKVMPEHPEKAACNICHAYAVTQDDDGTVCWAVHYEKSK
jgi:hypothetical protein